MHSDSIYFYLNSSKQNEGPFTWQELEFLKNRGTINHQTYVISVIDKQWLTLANLSYQIQAIHNSNHASGRNNAAPSGNQVSWFDKMLKRNPILNYFFLPITKSYFDFSGRATRKEFWMFYLLRWFAELTFSIVAFACMFLFSMLWGTAQGDAAMGIMSGIFTVMPAAIVLYIIGFLFLIIPNLALAIRRLHDTGYSGVTLLLLLVPFIGSLIILILLAQPSKFGENEYGPQPKNR